MHNWFYVAVLCTLKLESKRFKDRLDPETKFSNKKKMCIYFI